MEERSKYNVSKDTSSRSYGEIVFDSALEMKYYRDVLCPLMESGEVVKVDLQKRYVLQPGFIRDGKRVLPIYYDCDFAVEYADGHHEVIDIKGMPDSKALIKRKMFWYVYPDIDYKWLAYVKKYGGWVLYDDLKSLRSKDKLARKKLKEEKENGKA